MYPARMRIHLNRLGLHHKLLAALICLLVELLRLDLLIYLRVLQHKVRRLLGKAQIQILAIIHVYVLVARRVVLRVRLLLF